VLLGRYLTLSRDIVRIVDQPRNSRVLNTCPIVSIDIPNANGENVGVDMSCVAAGLTIPPSILSRADEMIE
jgi:hypothetical protein